MAKVRVGAFSVSVDGFGAGPEQSLDDPLGKNGEQMHGWFFPTRFFRTMIGKEHGETGIDNDFGTRAMTGFGAFILGRNMYGPIRGEWNGTDWKGWWGDNPPYHTSVFVLSHHERKPVEMEGGTLFHFVTDGIGAALTRAREAAKGKDVRLGGGVAAIRQFLQAALIDELHIAIAPILLGSGEHLFHGLDLPALGYQCKAHVASENATHIILGKS